MNHAAEPKGPIMWDRMVLFNRNFFSMGNSQFLMPRIKIRCEEIKMRPILFCLIFNVSLELSSIWATKKILTCWHDLSIFNSTGRDTWCSKEKLKFEEKNRVTMLFSLTVLSIGVSIAMCLCSGWSELKQNMLTKKLQQIKNPEIFIIKKERKFRKGNNFTRLDS